MRARLLLVLAALALAPSACAPSVKSASAEAARGAAPAAVQSTLDKLEDPQTRKRLEGVLATPEIQAAIRELSSGVSQGVLEGLSGEALDRRIDELVERFTGRLVEIVRGTIDGAIDEAASPENQAKLQAMASALTASVMRTAGRELPSTIAPALHEAIVQGLGPDLRAAMQHDVAPAMAATLRTPEFRSALDDTVHSLAKQAVLGSNEGLAELSQQEKHNAGGSPLGVLGAFFAKRTWLLVLVIAAGVFALLVLWLWRERVAARRFREEAERRNARAAALLGAMEASGEGVSTSRILQMLREQLLLETTEQRAAPPPPKGPPEPQHA